MRSVLISVVGVLLCNLPFVRADGKGLVAKIVKEDPPNQLAAPIRSLLSKSAIRLQKDGKTVADIWLIDSVTSAKGDSVQYSDLSYSALLGAIRFAQPWKDYRSQKIPAGVYTIRYATQPQDGDHMGTAPYPTFAVLIAAKFDPKADPYGPKELAERSAASINTTHPAVLLLFPAKKAEAKPALMPYPNDHVALVIRHMVRSGDKRVALPLALTVVGHAAE